MRTALVKARKGFHSLPPKYFVIIFVKIDKVVICFSVTGNKQTNKQKFNF